MGLRLVKSIAFVLSWLILIFHLLQNFVSLSIARVNLLEMVSILQDDVYKASSSAYKPE
uniref:Uncharacterized protein n=1 Tax=Rhodnius prolixus TaxID=13249 RepID=T1HMP2_RHOPR